MRAHAAIVLHAFLFMRLNFSFFLICSLSFGLHSVMFPVMCKYKSADARSGHGGFIRPPLPLYHHVSTVLLPVRYEASATPRPAFSVPLKLEGSSNVGQLLRLALEQISLQGITYILLASECFKPSHLILRKSIE
jgi:hypothetical protein